MGKMEKQPRINRRKLVICIVKTIIISAIAILFVMPLIWMGLSALKTTNEVFANPTAIPLLLYFFLRSDRLP